MEGGFVKVGIRGEKVIRGSGKQAIRRPPGVVE
jgi:hypothetical protein